MMKNLNIILLLILISNANLIFSQRVNDFPKRADPLYIKVDMFTKLMLGNNWNEGLIMQRVIYPPVGVDRPVLGPHADCLDSSTEMLVAYSHKYAIQKTRRTGTWQTSFLKRF